MINWFEWDKNETEVNGRVDWTVTNTPAVREAFTAALPDWLSYGPAGPPPGGLSLAFSPTRTGTTLAP